MRAVFAALTLLCAAPAQAARLAVLAANNAGWAGERPLKYAHRDALRLAATLTELGEFGRGDVVVVRNASPDAIKDAILRMRTRAEEAANSGEGSLFMFYYSGHADEDGLHLGRTHLSYADLKALVARVPAKVRVSLVDTCHSGTLTRIKGKAVAPFQVDIAGPDGVAGDVMLTSASAHEKAQESDRIQGSYFTSFVTTGLRGAADADRDGQVTLEELYTFAYRKTVGRTSGTPAGAQHPARRYDLRGQGEVVLTYPARGRACLVFPPEHSASRFLVLTAGDDVVAEVVPRRDNATRLALRPGSYSVRTRSNKGVYEQQLRLLADECRRVQPDQMHKVILPDTLSKGELLRETWAVQTGYVVSLGDISGEGLPLHGISLQLRIPIEGWALRPGFEYRLGSTEGRLLPIRSDLWEVNLATTRDFATPFGLAAVGPFVAYGLLHQDVEPRADRWISGLNAGLYAQFAVPVPLWRLFMTIESWIGYARLGLTDEGQNRVLAKLGVGLGVWW